MCEGAGAVGSVAANQALFERVRRLVGRRTVLATNTFRVSKGWLGVKTDYRFHEWRDDEAETVRDRLLGRLVGATTAGNNLGAKEEQRQ